MQRCVDPRYMGHLVVYCDSGDPAATCEWYCVDCGHRERLYIAPAQEAWRMFRQGDGRCEIRGLDHKWRPWLDSEGFGDSEMRRAKECSYCGRVDKLMEVVPAVYTWQEVTP